MLTGHLQRPRFDPRAFLVYWLDVDKGYRGVTQRCWRAIRLTELQSKPPRWNEKQRVHLKEKMEIDAAPDVFIEPTLGGKLRVTAPVRLVVQLYGDRLPVTVDQGSVEVSYGSVVRAGPLLLSILYAEQVDSLAEGKISLPFIGGTQQLEPDDRGLAEFVKPFEERWRKLQLWKVAFGLSFLLAGICSVAIVLSTGMSFRYGDAPMDSVAACVSLTMLAWTGLMSIGLPIHRALFGWVYSGGSKEDPLR